jgi:hypothetical protein
VAAGEWSFPAFTSSLGTTLGINQVWVCDLAQFLENILGNFSRFRDLFTIT